MLQDHLYDYAFPAEPWVPIADAAQREGLSYLALGLAIVLRQRVHGRGSFSFVGGAVCSVQRWRRCRYGRAGSRAGSMLKLSRKTLSGS